MRRRPLSERRSHARRHSHRRSRPARGDPARGRSPACEKHIAVASRRPVDQGPIGEVERRRRYKLRPPRRRRRRAATRPGARFVGSPCSRHISSRYRVTPPGSASAQTRDRSTLIIDPAGVRRHAARLRRPLAARPIGGPEALRPRERSCRARSCDRTAYGDGRPRWSSPCARG